MSHELINRISIKKNGVYVSTHSNNDTAPYHSVKVDFLTESYLSGGQKALDESMIEFLLNAGEIRGNHESIIPYKKALEEFYNSRDNTLRDRIASYETLLWDYSYGNTSDPEYDPKVGISKSDLIRQISKDRKELCTKIAENVEKYREKLEREKDTYNLYAIIENDKMNPYTIKVGYYNSIEEAEKKRKQFIDEHDNVMVMPTNKEELNNRAKILNTWITSYPKQKNSMLEDKVEKIYMVDFNEEINDSLNGNVIFGLNNYNLSKSEEKLLKTMIINDERILDFEYDKEYNDVDVIVGLDYCPNAELDEIEDEEDEM